MEAGDVKGTLSFIGSSDTPLLRGKMESLATKAASFSSTRIRRTACWSSARKMASSTLRASSFWYTRASSTHLGRKSKRIFSSSPALMVRPNAGNPTWNLAMIPDVVIWQALRSNTSCPHLLIDISPLFPEPFALKLKSSNRAYRRLVR